MSVLVVKTSTRSWMNDSGVTVTTSTKEGADNSAQFDVTGTIDSSGIYRINMSGTGNTLHPMAPRGDGKIVWFGTVTGIT